MNRIRGWRWPYLVLFIAAVLFAVVEVQLFIFPPPQGPPSLVGGVVLGAGLYGVMAFAWRRGRSERPVIHGQPPDSPERPDL
jgi:hypothetical protein